MVTVTCSKVSNSSAISPITTSAPVTKDAGNVAVPINGLSNAVFSEPAPPSNMLVDSAPSVDSVFVAPSLSSNTLIEVAPNADSVNQNIVDPMFSVPELPTSNPLETGNPGNQPLTEEKTNPTLPEPTLPVPEVPTSNIEPANPGIQPVIDEITNPIPSNQILSVPESPTSNSLAATNTGIQQFIEEKTNPILSLSRSEESVINPINEINQAIQTNSQGNTFAIIDNMSNNEGNTVADTVEPTMQAATNTLLGAPESNNETMSPTSSMQSPEQGNMNIANAVPKSPMNEIINPNINVDPIMYDAMSALFVPQEMAQTNEVNPNTSLSVEPPMSSGNELSPNSNSVNPNSLLSVEPPMNTANELSPTSNTAMSEISPTEMITGAILFPGNWDETKQKNYQSLDLVNQNNNSDLNPASNDLLLQHPAENTLDSVAIAPADTLKLDSLDVAPVLSSENGNSAQINEAVEQNSNDIGNAAMQSTTNLSSVMTSNTDIGTALSPNLTDIETTNSKVDAMMNNVVDNTNILVADQTKAQTNATHIETDSSLISVPLLRSKINLNSNNMSGNSINELSSDNDFLTALKGILPVIAQNLNKTGADQITETNATDTLIESNQSALVPELGSQLFSSSIQENSEQSNQSKELGTPFTNSESNQSSGTLDTGSQLLLNTRDNVDSNQISGSLQTASHLLSNTRQSFESNSVNSDMNTVGRDKLGATLTDSMASFQTPRPSESSSVSMSVSSDSTTQENKPDLVTDIIPTKRVADSIINSFLQDGLLRLSDDVKRQSTESVATTQSTVTTTNKPEISTPSHQETTTVDTFNRNDGVSVSASSVDIRTIRVEDQPQPERSGVSIVSGIVHSLNETTSLAHEETTTSTVSSPSSERQSEPTTEPTPAPEPRSEPTPKSTSEPTPEPKPEPTSSSTMLVNEPRSNNIANTSLVVSSSIHKDKHADASTTPAVTELETTTDTASPAESTTDSSQSTISVKSSTFAIPVNTGVDMLTDMKPIAYPSDLYDAALANPDAFAPVVIPGLVTETTMEPPTSEPVSDFTADNTMSNLGSKVEDTVDPDLAFTIVRLLKILADQSGVQTTSTSELNETSVVTTPEAVMPVNTDGRHGNETIGTENAAIIRNVDNAITDFETAVIAERPVGENNTDTANISVSDTKMTNHTEVVADGNKQKEIKDNVAEPSDNYARLIPNEVIENVTQNTVQTTKKPYSVVVNSETDKHSESNVITNEVDTSYSSLEDDPDLFGIDRKSLSKYSSLYL